MIKMSLELKIKDVGGALGSYVIWPIKSPLSPGTIQEARSYYFELKDHTNPASVEQADLYIDGLPLEALRSPGPGVAKWRWNPGFHAGKIRISIEIPGSKSNEFELVIDPDIEKLTRDDFNIMVRDILHDTKAVFSLSGFRTGISKGSGRNVPPIARLEFLRSRFLEIEDIVKEICKCSVRVLCPQEVVMPISKIRQINPTEYLTSLKKGRVVGTASRNRVAVNYLPTTVHKVQKVSGVDIREHRDIKDRLKSWQTILSIFKERLVTESGGDPDKSIQQTLWAKRCAIMSRRLGLLLAHPFFSEVGDHKQPMVMTSIYRRLPVYRRFFHLHRDIEAGISDVLGDHLDLPLSRTFDLYELWAFLRLLRAAIQLYGLKIVPKELFKSTEKKGSIKITPDNVIVDLQNGFGLAFKRQFKEYWLQSDRIGSYSRVMEPDISLITSKSELKPAKLIVFDAKYRIKSALNDAISSIHMYRDAIVEGSVNEPSAIVAGAYILSPHKPFWNDDWEKTKMPGRLFHPKYRSQFKFGAANLSPGMSMSDVCLCLSTMIDDAVGKNKHD